MSQLVQLKTPAGGKYDLNLHNTLMGVNELGKKTLGHTDVLGQAGSGKTVLLMFMMVMMQKWRNAELFAVNSPGQYFLIRTGRQSQGYAH